MRLRRDDTRVLLAISGRVRKAAAVPKPLEYGPMERVSDYDSRR